MKLTTAGESHGKALVAIVEGLPSHLRVEKEKINADLALRQSGYGRGGRQRIETDEVEILTGVRDGETIGSPVTLCIFNKDYKNWAAVMTDGDCDQAEKAEKAVTRVRPGHADLTGAIKFGQSDARNVLERASARETAIRVAAGSLYKQYLSELGVEISGMVREICGVRDGGEYSFLELKQAKSTPTGMINASANERAMQKIAELRASGDTAGGVVEIRVRGLKRGFGSMMTYAEKLDGLLAGNLMSVQAIKAVEIGDGNVAGSVSGKQFHDEIFYEDGEFKRKTNRSGGIEGGMSNGEEIVVRAVMKPIPTLMKGLKTVDYQTKEEAVAASERSDVCAIFALEIIAEAVVAETVANVVQARLGGDTIAQVKARYCDLP